LFSSSISVASKKPNKNASTRPADELDQQHCSLPTSCPRYLHTLHAAIAANPTGHENHARDAIELSVWHSKGQERTN
jgi:hypothetical protein